MLSITRQTMAENVARDRFDKLDEIEARLQGCVRKAENAVKKNAQLHLMIDSGLLEKIRVKSENQGISVSELCRRKLADDSQLERMDAKLNLLIKNYGK